MNRLLVLILLNACFALAAHAEGGRFANAASSPASAYGAAAYDVKTRSWAYGVKFAAPAQATAAVSKLCGPTCLVYGPFEQCGLVATNGSDAAFGEGADMAAAETVAKGKCAGGGCEVAVWGCNPTADREGSGYRRETSHPKNFGAITYDAASGAVGAVWDYASFAAAIAAAKSHCGAACRIYLAQAGDCGALAAGDGAIAIGDGTDFPTAQRKALAKCGKSACRTLAWFCNSRNP